MSTDTDQKRVCACCLASGLSRYAEMAEFEVDPEDERDRKLQKQREAEEEPYPDFALIRLEQVAIRAKMEKLPRLSPEWGAGLLECLKLSHDHEALRLLKGLTSGITPARVRAGADEEMTLVVSPDSKFFSETKRFVCKDPEAFMALWASQDLDAIVACDGCVASLVGKGILEAAPQPP